MINKIRIGDMEYDIEPKDLLVVDTKEPTGENIRPLWIKPNVDKTLDTLGYAKMPGSTNHEGDYTIGENGELIETSDTSSGYMRATNLVDLFINKEYRIAANYSGTQTSSYPFKVDIYFYDNEGNYIPDSKVSGEIASSGTFILNETLVTFTMPEGARKIRANFTVNGAYHWSLIPASEEVISRDYMYGTGDLGIEFYALDTDHYIKLN